MAPIIRVVPGTPGKRDLVKNTLKALKGKNFSSVEGCTFEDPSMAYTVVESGKVIQLPLSEALNSEIYKVTDPHAFLFNRGDKVKVIGGTNAHINEILTIASRCFLKTQPGYHFDIEKSGFNIAEKNLELVERARVTEPSPVPSNLFDNMLPQTFYAKDPKTVYENKVYRAASSLRSILERMSGYGCVVTEDEWNDPSITKYTINRDRNQIVCCQAREIFSFLAFHTEEQRNEFLFNNERLVRDYLMLD